MQAAQASVEASDGSVSFWLGRYHAERGEHAAAERSFREAMAREPGNPEYLLGLVKLYWSDRSSAAWFGSARSPRVKELVAELSQHARSAWQLNAVAVNQLVNRDIAGALGSSQQACELGPDCWECFHNRAVVLSTAGQAEAAVAAELAALDHLPDHASDKIAKVLRDAVGFYSRAAASTDQGQAKRPFPIGP